MDRGDVDPLNPSVRGVRLNRLSRRGRVRMVDLVGQGVAFAAALVGEERPEPISRFTQAIAERMVDGEAPDGLRIEDLCRGKTSPGHIREHFGAQMGDVADLAVRAILRGTSRDAVHGYVTSLPMKAGPDSEALGVDQNPGAAKTTTALLGCLGTGDCPFPVRANWLLTDTRDDHTHPRADQRRIERHSTQLGRPLAGSVAEHLYEHYAGEDRSLGLTYNAAKAGNSAFRRYGIDPQRFIRRNFPRCQIVDSTGAGAPHEPGDPYGRLIFTGDDEDVVGVMLERGRYGIARAQLPDSKVPLELLEDGLLPELAERLGEPAREVAPKVLTKVAKWPRASMVGIGTTAHAARFWWFPESGRLLRAAQVPGEDEGEVVMTQLWRMVGLGGAQLHGAVALAERAAQQWPRACLMRYKRETEIGKMHPWHARQRECILWLSLIANAAAVSACREEEINRLRGA